VRRPAAAEHGGSGVLYVLLGLLVIAVVLVVGTLSLFAPHHHTDHGAGRRGWRGLAEGDEIIGRSP
jgi:hypothetical protein